MSHSYYKTLLPKIQRTKVESKSQPLLKVLFRPTSCYQKYKEQKLKANHNTIAFVFIAISLLPKIQRTKVESKSQLLLTMQYHKGCCYQKYKEQKLKANHNRMTNDAQKILVVTKNTKNKS